MLLPHFWMGECRRNKRFPPPSVYSSRTIVLTKFAPVGWPKRWESRWLAVDENNKTFQPETFGLSMHVEAYRRPSLIFRNQPCSRKKHAEFLLLIQFQILYNKAYWVTPSWMLGLSVRVHCITSCLHFVSFAFCLFFMFRYICILLQICFKLIPVSTKQYGARLLDKWIKQYKLGRIRQEG